MLLLIYTQLQCNFCVRVCVLTGIHTEQYNQIMRCWSSNLGQGFLHSQTLPLAITTFILDPSPTCLSQFLDCFIPPSAAAPRQQRLLSYQLSVIPATHLLFCHRTMSTWASPTPTPLQLPPLALHPAPHACVCRHIPRSSPPCYRPRPAPRSLSAPVIYVTSAVCFGRQKDTHQQNIYYLSFCTKTHQKSYSNVIITIF